jgi:hypothetical protein
MMERFSNASLFIHSRSRQVGMSEELEVRPETETEATADELAALKQLVATRTRERDEVVQQRTQDRKAFDVERQELRREISALRHENEHPSEQEREIDRLKKELATAAEHAAESENQLVQIRKQHAEATAAAKKKTDALEICVQELSKDLEKLSAEKQQLLKDLETERARTAQLPAQPKGVVAALRAESKSKETPRFQAPLPGHESAMLLHQDPELKQAVDAVFGGGSSAPTPPPPETRAPAPSFANGGAAPPRADAGQKPIVRDTWSNLFRPQSGTWTVQDERYQAVAAPGGDAISLLQLGGPLPADLLIEVTAKAAPAAGHHSNAFVIFDYRSPSDFKYAGFRALAKKWVIGQCQDSKWLDLATVLDMLVSGADYRIRLSLRGSTAQLIVNGVSKGTCDFSLPLNAGSLGLATQGGTSQFFRMSIQSGSAVSAAS